MSDQELKKSELDELESPEQRLSALGISLPAAPASVAVYLPYQRCGDQLWISGQIALEGGSLKQTGQVGSELSLEEARDCARCCAINLIAQARAALGALSRVKRVVKIHVFVACGPDFHSQHLVANGASELLGEVFGELGRHARSAVGVSSLPLNSPVEIDAIFEVE